MNVKEFNLKGNKVVVVEAPLGTTHSSTAILDGGHFILHRKKKNLLLHAFDESKPDSVLMEEYKDRLINVGCLETVENGVVDDLFEVVKNGNFYDYQINGIFYPSAKSALKDLIELETGFINPYVLIIKPEIKSNLLAETLTNV